MEYGRHYPENSNSSENVNLVYENRKLTVKLVSKHLNMEN